MLCGHCGEDRAPIAQQARRGVSVTCTGCLRAKAGKGIAPTPDRGACSGGACGSNRLESMCYEVAVQGRRLGAAGGPGKRGHRWGSLDPSKKLSSPEQNGA